MNNGGMHVESVHPLIFLLCFDNGKYIGYTALFQMLAIKIGGIIYNEH